MIRIICALTLYFSWPQVLLADLNRDLALAESDEHYQKVAETFFNEVKKPAMVTHRLTKQERAQVKAKLVQLKRQIFETGNIPAQLPSDLTNIVVLPRNFLNIIENLKAIKLEYPSMTSISAHGQIASLFFMGMDYNLSTINPDRCNNIDCDCFRECEDTYRNAYNREGLGWFVNAILEPSPMTIMGGYVQAIIEIIDLQEELIQCKSTCEGFPEDFLCQSDSDCRADQYCHKPFGNPVRSCHIKRPLGWACSAHRKCESNCCKFHVWTNPIQKVCRPSDRC